MWIFAMTIPFGNQKIDLVAVNQRGERPSNCDSIELIAKRRELVASIRGGIATGANYGGCLYRSSQDGPAVFLYNVQGEWLRSRSNSPKMTRVLQREKSSTFGYWKIRRCRPPMINWAWFYIAAEDEGILRFDAEPNGECTRNDGSAGW